MSEKLTILFAPLEFVGIVNSCIGIAEVLRNSGHRIVFAISDKWKGKLNIYGFEEEIIELEKSETVEDPAKSTAESALKSGLFGSIPPIEKIKSLNATGFRDIVEQNKIIDPIMKAIVDRIKPDIIMIENVVRMPSLMSCDIPWVWIVTCNPLLIDYGIDDQTLPPSCLGLKLIYYQFFVI
jgi:UDP:flavonoid glycosyltransferase YjiC (YdhE family)